MKAEIVCNVCGKTFNSFDKLIKHMKEHHLEEFELLCDIDYSLVQEDYIMDIDYEWSIEGDEFVVDVYDYNDEDFTITAELEDVEHWISIMSADYEAAAENLISNYVEE